MLDNQIIRLLAIKDILNVVEPFMGKMLINGIHNSNLFIHDDIGIIRHTVRYFILPFKKVNLVVVDANVFY